MGSHLCERLLNEGNEVPEEYRELMLKAWGPVRAIIAAQRDYGDDVVGQLYTEIGTRIHPGGKDYETAVAEAVAVESAGCVAVIAQGWEAGGPRILAALDDSAASQQLSSLLNDIASLSDKVSLREKQGRYEFILVQDAGSHRIVELAKDHIAVEDIAGVNRTWIPITSVQSVTVTAAS